MIQPLGDKVLIKREDEAAVSAGGIVIPDSAKEKPQRGVVLNVGSKARDVRPGDHVLFAKYAGSDVAAEEGAHLMLREEDILAIVEQGDPDWAPV